MDNFTFCVPTKIIFGRDTERQVGKEVKARTDKVLLHYGGGSIKKSGLYARVVTSLKAENIEIVELSGVVPNPRLSLVREGIRICREQGITLILAVGGGSVIDSAKAIALGTPCKADFWEEFYVKHTPVTEALDIGVVLTIPAAGSEASNGTVISDEENERKLYAIGESLRPRFSILNPELTTTLPAYQTAAGIVDMMAHIMERYFSSTDNVDFTSYLCEGAIRSIIKNARKVLDDPQNYDYRAEIMLAGLVAHNDSLGLGRGGDWMTHDMEHELSAIWDITHGEGLAAMFPAWITYTHKQKLPLFVRYAEEVFGITKGSDEEKVMEAVRKLKEFYHSIGMRTSLKELGVEEDKIPLMAERCVPEGKRGGLMQLGKEDVEKIYRIAYAS